MPESSLSFEEKLDRYADLLVRIGVNLQPHQRLQVSAPLEAAPLVRAVARKAYEAGCRLVEVAWSDDALTRIRYESAPRDSFEEYPHWRVRASLEAVERDDAFLTIHAADPDLLAGIDGELVAAASRVAAQAQRPVSEKVSGFAMNWSIGSMPIPSWARRVFPDLSEEQAMARLWDAIFMATRADRPDAVGAWQTHLANLAARRAYLNERAFSALHFRGPGTDLTVGLADGHEWVGGAWPARNGRLGVPNLPTDEVFTAPHRDRVDGTVRATKPLSTRGALIEGIEVRFSGGRIVEARAARGEDVLTRLLDTDEGARRLGEVALVPASAPVAQTNLLFLNTLYDENAASHIALGRAG